MVEIGRFGMAEETIVRRDCGPEPGRADTDIVVLLRDRRRGSEGGGLVMRVWLAPQDPGRQLWYVTSGRNGKDQRVVVRQKTAVAHRARGDLRLAATVELWPGAICRYKAQLSDGGLQSLLVGQRL